jgi:hypothetical protein
VDSSARHYAPTRGPGLGDPSSTGTTGYFGSGCPRHRRAPGDEGIPFSGLGQRPVHGGFTDCQCQALSFSFAWELSRGREFVFVFFFVANWSTAQYEENHTQSFFECQIINRVAG